MIILKIIKNHSFTIFLEDTFFGMYPPAVLGLIKNVQKIVENTYNDKILLGAFYTWFLANLQSLSITAVFSS